MSILSEIPTSEYNKAEKKAARLRFLVENFANQTVRCWEETNDLIKSCEDKQMLFDVLGEDGEKVLDFNEEMLNFISNLLSGKKQSIVDSVLTKAANMPNTSVNENGKVTIV